MASNFNFDILGSILGESAALDSPRLYISDGEQASQFINTYGYNLSNPSDQEKLWRYHRSAIEFLENVILKPDEKIPTNLRNKEELNDISKLLMIASVSQGQHGEQKTSSFGQQDWACAILRVMHVLVHLDNDLFSSFTDDIKYQILKPIQDHIYHDGERTFLGEGDDAIELVSYSEKPFKHTHSATIKLLTRKNALAMTLLDRVGVRFITKDVLGIFQVIQYLIDKHMISYPHVISSQSKNTICPTQTFMHVLEKSISVEGEFNAQEIEKMLKDEIKTLSLNAETRLNPFSSADFKFLKFINRQFLRINRGEELKPLSFFFPFEVQIADEQTFENNTKGKSSHVEYKKRQRDSARQKLFGL